VRYPELPYYKQFSNQELMDLYNEVQVWSSQIINELDSRDEEVRATPTTQIFTEVTTSNVAKPLGGQVVYSASAGKFYGWNAVTSAWAAFT
jgi:hypothetical protein